MLVRWSRPEVRLLSQSNGSKAGKRGRRQPCGGGAGPEEGLDALAGRKTALPPQVWEVRDREAQLGH